MESKVTHNMVDDKPLQTPKYVKILNEYMQHYHFKYKLGLNTDDIPFDPSGSCKPGGLYFTNLDNSYKFLNHGDLIADVEVPKGVEIYADPDGDKWKAPSIIISNIRKVSELPQWNDLGFCTAAVRLHGFALKYVPEKLKTKEICLSAVQNNARIVKFIPIDMRTKAICLIAVQKNWETLEFVPK